MLERAALGPAAAVLVALAAWRVGSLTSGGAVAAAAVGAVAIAAGWGWSALLILYFVAAVLLGRIRGAERERRTCTVVEKRGARDARQVLANGGAFAAGALVVALSADPSAVLTAAALGALATSAADSWATELGTLAAAPPRSIMTGAVVARGTSGGITAVGLLASAAGAAFVALAGRVCIGVAAPVGAVLAAGVAGSLADSLLGALVQERRWCDTCARSTERRMHDCGAATRHAGGISGLDNDAVNLLATLAGALVAAALAAR